MAGRHEFSYAEASGFNMFSALLGAGLVFEGIPAHLLLHRWNPWAAWISTALCIYGLVWVFLAARSVRIRPILVGDQSVILQLGFLWRVEIQRQNIKILRRIRSGEVLPRKQPGYLRLVVINDPQWLMELRQPVVAHGTYGLRRNVNRISLSVDDAAAFSASIAQAPVSQGHSPAATGLF